MRKIAIITLAGALALGACGRGESETQPIENEAIDNEVEVIEEPAPINVVEPEPEVNNTTPAAPPPEISEEEQMLDDADATGLTARLPQDDEGLPGSTENETLPVD